MPNFYRFSAITKILIISILVAGCTSVPTAVTVLCKVPAVNKPDFYFDHVSRETTLFEKVKSLLAEREQRIGYEEELKAASKVCE